MGVAETSEQVYYLGQVAPPETRIQVLQGDAIKARLHLLGIARTRIWLASTPTSTPSTKENNEMDQPHSDRRQPLRGRQSGAVPAAVLGSTFPYWSEWVLRTLTYRKVRHRGATHYLSTWLPLAAFAALL